MARRPAAAATLLAGLLATGVAACGFALASGHQGRPAQPAGQPTLLPVPKGKRAPVPGSSAVAAVARPSTLIIPVIGVRSHLIRLGVTKAGTMQVPPSAAVAGWYTGSPRPGAVGAAVIAGHIDSRQGPGIFYHLHQLSLGDRVYVRRADNTVAVFKVTAVHMYLKADFPASAVYGAVPDAQLRLITCGGAFDPATGHYLSNVIAFAQLIR
ncbi:MAG TPA: class F sortase [Streptosporangiaceae bacterium]